MDKKNKINQKEEVKCEAKYTEFQQFLTDTHVPYEPVKNPKHLYQIELHRSVFTQEIFDLYERYEKSVHNQTENDAKAFKSFFCSSPLYDPDQHEQEKNRPSLMGHEKIDEFRTFKEGGDGLYPGLGSYHIYHKIDGKVVAVGNLDISKTILNTQYFLIDPDYRFLALGVVGAIHELEYMKTIQKKFNPQM